LGRTTNAVSGIAVQKRQEQGSLATNKPFDNLRLAFQMQGEIQISLIEQFVTEQKSFRITNQRGTPEFIDMNDGLPENDITRSKADFIISEAEWRATMRQAAAEQLMEMITRMPPDVAMAILDLAVDCMDDLPNREEITKRIRSINGQKDPDATEITPEEQAKMDAAAKQQQFADEMAMAELEGKVAETDKKKADARKAMASADREEAQTMQTRVDATNTAMLAATSVVRMPTIAKVADGILQEAGWKNFALSGLPPQQSMQNKPATIEQNIGQQENMAQNDVPVVQNGMPEQGMPNNQIA
jgi:hypothetical protein